MSEMLVNLTNLVFNYEYLIEDKCRTTSVPMYIVVKIFIDGI